MGSERFKSPEDAPLGKRRRLGRYGAGHQAVAFAQVGKVQSHDHSESSWPSGRTIVGIWPSGLMIAALRARLAMRTDASTEASRVVRSLLSDLIDRGLDADRARL
jgi:hypothetical protein